MSGVSLGRAGVDVNAPEIVSILSQTRTLLVAHGSAPSSLRQLPMGAEQPHRIASMCEPFGSCVYV